MKTTKVCYAFSTVCNLSKLKRRKNNKTKKGTFVLFKNGEVIVRFRSDTKAVQSPLFFPIIVNIERFVLRAAILVLNVPSGERREARKVEKLSRFHTHAQAILGTYKTKIDALRVGSGSRRSYRKEGDYEQSNQYTSRETKDNFHKQIIQRKLTIGVLLPYHSSGKALFKD